MSSTKALLINTSHFFAINCYYADIKAIDSREERLSLLVSIPLSSEKIAKLDDSL